MAIIRLETIVNAPIEVCFNLARSIDAHQHSTRQTNEKAVAGRISGLINKGETVTWQARHFGVSQRLTVKISKLDYPVFFEDVMQKGAFKTMQHRHTFISLGDTVTLMKDEFCYTVPLGILGKLFDNWILKNYMTRFLQKRNKTLKQTAENGQWKQFINTASS